MIRGWVIHVTSAAIGLGFRHVCAVMSSFAGNELDSSSIMFVNYATEMGSRVMMQPPSFAGSACRRGCLPR
jgi:hypothetical protein